VATVTVVNPMVYAMNVTLSAVGAGDLAPTAAADGWAVDAVAALPPAGVTVAAAPAVGDPPLGGAVWARDDPASATAPPVATAHPRGGRASVAVPLIWAPPPPPPSGGGGAAAGGGGGADRRRAADLRFALTAAVRCVDGADVDDMAAPWACRVDVSAPPPPRGWGG